MDFKSKRYRPRGHFSPLQPQTPRVLMLLELGLLRSGVPVIAETYVREYSRWMCVLPPSGWGRGVVHIFLANKVLLMPNSAPALGLG